MFSSMAFALGATRHAKRTSWLSLPRRFRSSLILSVSDRTGQGIWTNNSLTSGGFLKWGIPLDHPFIDGCSIIKFINQQFLGYPHWWKPPFKDTKFENTIWKLHKIIQKSSPPDFSQASNGWCWSGPIPVLPSPTSQNIPKTIKTMGTPWKSLRPDMCHGSNTPENRHELLGG